MVLKQILDKTTLKDVQKAYLKYYPGWDDAHIDKVYNTLTSIKPSQDIDMTINIREDDANHFPGDDSYEVFGSNGTYKPNATNILYEQGEEPLEEFALEFYKWEDWLDMEVSIKTLKKYDNDEIVALCIFEMTVFGYCQEDITAQKTNVFDLINQNILEI